MDSLLQFDVTHAYLVVFAAVLLDVIALPLVAMPVLLLAGGLAATGKVSLLVIIGFATLASAAGDTLWYSIGRYGSPQLMGFLGRTGGKRQEYFFRSIRFIQRYGLGFLIVSKFVPGVASLACPAAGIVNMSVSQFLAHERAEPCFLGHQYCLGGLFRNFLFRDTAASILNF